MMIRSQNIECDIYTQTAKPVHFVQGEKGREVMFTFVNSAIPIEDEPQPILLSGLTATIHILKPDGNFIIDNMTISGNAALYTLGENACAAGGAGVYDVSLSRGTDVVYTAHGAYVGDFRAISDDVVNSVSEAYGVTFPEGFQQKLTPGENINISDDNVISAQGGDYTEGDGINISNKVISVDGDLLNTITAMVAAIAEKQDTLTAGSGIDITNNVISATGGYSRTDLWTGSTDISQAGSLEISDAYTNYDELVFFYHSDVGPISGSPIHFESALHTDNFTNGKYFTISDMFVYSNAGIFTYGQFTDTTHMAYNRWIGQGLTNVVLTKIVGIKY